MIERIEATLTGSDCFRSFSLQYIYILVFYSSYFGNDTPIVRDGGLKRYFIYALDSLHQAAKHGLAPLQNVMAVLRNATKIW